MSFCTMYWILYNSQFKHVPSVHLTLYMSSPSRLTRENVFFGNERMFYEYINKGVIGRTC